MLDKKPEPWSPVDTIAIAKLIAWGLSGGENDLELKVLADALGPRFLEVALPREVNTPILPRKAKFSPTGLALGMLIVTGAIGRAKPLVRHSGRNKL